MNFLPTLTKELKELARSYKLLFVPLAFLLLGLGQPIMYKMLPLIMQSASNLPEGSVLQIPIPPPAQIVAGTFGQLNQLGILILVLVAMGSIAGERNSGVAATVLTKPVGRGEYLTAKAVSFSLLAVASLMLGLGLTAYYTQVLFGPVDWGATAAATLLYLPNLLVVVAVTLFCSTLMASPLAAGGTALTVVIFLNVVPKYLGKFIASIYPGALMESAVAAALGKSYAVAGPVAGVLAISLLFLTAGWIVLKRREI